ncbi:MAG: hypothetical protein ACRDV3_17330 [Acidothermaceae bacterium]
MAVEIVACVLGVLGLILVGVLDAFGVMGLVGVVRFADCAECSHWTVSSRRADPLCWRCRHHARVAAGGHHLRLGRVHFGH